MSEPSIHVHAASVRIPVFMPGQQRLLRKPRLLSTVGSPVDTSGGRIHVEALTKIDLSLSRGQHLGLLGHNGSGKSTLLRLLAGIYPPTTGTVETNGTIGCLFDTGTGATPDMTAREVIKNHIMIRRGLTPGWRDIADEVEAFSELGTFVDLPMRTYSDGMRARLMAALATAWPRDILLMDEGIGAGDAAFHERFARRLENHMGAAGLLVVASHNMDLLRQYCSLGLVLKRGTALHFGPIETAIAEYERSVAA